VDTARSERIDEHCVAANTANLLRTRHLLLERPAQLGHPLQWRSDGSMTRTGRTFLLYRRR
jgi:hypothetical protein